jgi:hypothetical protein
VNENLIAFFRSKPEIFPFRRSIDLHAFLLDLFDDPAAILPVPAKIFLVDELQPQSYGFPVIRADALDELTTKLDKWMGEELAARVAGESAMRQRSDETFAAYRTMLVSLAQNALHSSILADYHIVFWLVHSQSVAKLFTNLPRRIVSAGVDVARGGADAMKYLIYQRWADGIRAALTDVAGIGLGQGYANDRSFRFVRLMIDNSLILTEDFVSSDVRELRTYFSGSLRRDHAAFKRWFDELQARAAELMTADRTFRRAVANLGYPETAPGMIAVLDRRVQQLIFEHAGSKTAPDQAFFESVSRRLLEYLIVYHLRRGITWMKTTAQGDNVSEDRGSTVYSRAIRPMNFGRRGIVEPIVYRYGLVYDITSFTQTLGEIARGGKEGEQSSYRQMLDFQRELAEITRRWSLQFEKFLGDGAFYTSRRATRTVQAAIDIQQFYSSMRANGFAFNRGMRIAINYGYYRLLPMQVSTDGTEIMEFYGPGIVELSRLTTGKATKEIEDIQHLLLSHGYDQMEVYRFFAPLSRGTRAADAVTEDRDFYAYVDENGHLVNEGIVASIPFLKQLTQELTDEGQRLYRLRAPRGNYIGIPSTSETATYVAMRILGAVSLKGIGSVDVAEVVRLTADDAEISLVEDERPLLKLLQQEWNRSTARMTESKEDAADTGASDLVVCESHMQRNGPPVILVGEWDPVAEEVRRPIQLDGHDAERYGLEVPLTVEVVESQTGAYQNLYRKLSRLETLPNFSVQAIRQNANFSGFIIGGDAVEPL